MNEEISRMGEKWLKQSKRKYKNKNEIMLTMTLMYVT